MLGRVGIEGTWYVVRGTWYVEGGSFLPVHKSSSGQQNPAHDNVTRRRHHGKIVVSQSPPTPLPKRPTLRGPALPKARALLHHPLLDYNAHSAREESSLRQIVVETGDFRADTFG